MPQQQQLVDLELQAGDFLELNDLVGPLDVEVAQPDVAEDSGLTVSLGLQATGFPGGANSYDSVVGGQICRT